MEKKNQSIRDDILEMNNMNPSYTRQAEGEWAMAQKREKEYQVKAFIERARENGFDVVLDEDLNIIRVRKIAKPKPYQFR